jgi:hypothetical protein
MKNIDALSKRFLAITLGLSALLLSGSLFIFSLNAIPSASAGNASAPEKINAMNPEIIMKALQDDMQDDDVRAIQAFGIGIRDGNLYFGILYSNNTIGLHKSLADGEDVLDW